MKFSLTLNGLDPAKELARHDMLAVKYRTQMVALGRRRKWRWHDLLESAIYHEESAQKLRSEGV